MPTLSRERVTPKTRKGRTCTVQPLTKLHINSDAVDSTEALRLQFLGRFGIPSARARLVATFAFGEAA